MQATGIEWTDFSANLLKYRDESGKSVWHCEKTSPGCAHCYSETLANRYGRGGPFLPMVTPKVTPYFDEGEAAKIIRSKKLDGKRVFVDDMTDLFGEWVPDEIIDQHFATFALRPDVTFQVLTKRAKRMRDHLSSRDFRKRFLHGMLAIAEEIGAGFNVEPNNGDGIEDGLLLPNVWLGVSVEDQQRADERIPHLLATPAALRFLSCEPLLGQVNVTRYLNGICFQHDADFGGSGVCMGHKSTSDWLPCVDWVIVGGESGRGARPCDLAWVRSLVEQCILAEAPCFVKQLGSQPLLMFEPGQRATVEGVLGKLTDLKGGNIEEWPEDLRVREWPQAATASRC